MDFNNFSGHAYLLIGGLVLIGAGLVLVSVVVNRHVAKSALEDERHREKLYEYYRNTLAQLGIILIGIGISLFTFFFQQNYKDARDRETELQRVLSRIAVRVGRAAPAMEALAEFDPVLDQGAPYSSESYSENQPIDASGPELARKVKQIQAAMRDVDLQQFDVTTLSRDIEESSLIGELDPGLWFDITRDESYAKYAIAQLTLDYENLRNAIGSEPIERVVTDPGKEAAIKSELREIFYDMDLLRDRARRAVGRACWFVSSGPRFVRLKPLDEIEADYKTHDEWLRHAQRAYVQFDAGRENCFTLLHARPNGELQDVRSEAAMPKLKAR